MSVTAQAPATILTPLTHNDAMGLVMEAAPNIDVAALARLTVALMAVDVASREQSGAKELAEAVLAYDTAIKGASLQGKSWIENANLDALYEKWLTLAHAIVPEADGPELNVVGRWNEEQK